MNSFTKEEYLKLVEQLLEEQYGSNEADYCPPEEAWIPSESPLKEKFSQPSYDGLTDLTDAKKDKIKNSLHKCRNLKIGGFLVKITRYSGEPEAGEICVDIVIYEEVYQNHLGNSSKMVNKIDVAKDDRFMTRPWASNFNKMKYGARIPMSMLADIIRWLQAVQKMTAFL